MGLLDKLLGSKKSSKVKDSEKPSKSDKDSEMKLPKKWVNNLKQYGVTDKDIETRQKEFAGRERDLIWSMFNNLILDKAGDFQDLKMIYYDMALFLNEEGKNPFQNLQLSNKMELTGYKNEGVEKVEILSAGDKSCLSCQGLNGKIYAIEDALEEAPIPERQCSTLIQKGKCGFCRCTYAPIIDVD